jgi:protein SCO1
MRHVFCAALALLAAACGPATAPREAEAGAAEAVRITASDFSVHDLDGAWRNQDGAEVRLSEVGGRVQVVAMVYASCSHTCPQIISELKRIEGRLAGDQRQGTRFVLISLDPDRDTPARLREWAASLRLDPARWTLLTGPAEQVREMAALLGLRYRQESGGDFSHTNAYLVLDGSGRIVHRQVGLGTGVDASLGAIRGAAALR